MLNPKIFKSIFGEKINNVFQELEKKYKPVEAGVNVVNVEPAGIARTVEPAGTLEADGIAEVDEATRTLEAIEADGIAEPAEPAGTSGTSGTVGTVGTAGTVGTVGTVGTAGTVGTVGTAGTVGTSGTAGTSGTDEPAGTIEAARTAEPAEDDQDRKAEVLAGFSEILKFSGGAITKPVNGEDLMLVLIKMLEIIEENRK